MKRPGDDNGADAQVDHLLEVVSRHRDERCAKLRAQAREQARTMMHQAHARERARMHEHIVEIREKYRLRIAAARARNETLARLQLQQAGQLMLDQAREPLRAALIRRWQNESTRRLWIDALLEVAARTLLAHDWRIEHPPAWPQAERDDLQLRVHELGATATHFAGYDDIDAGLRIVARGASIDASLVGLLQRKTAIESVLMARLVPLMTSDAPTEQGMEHHD